MIRRFARLLWAIITLPYGIFKAAGVAENAIKEMRERPL